MSIRENLKLFFNLISATLVWLCREGKRRETSIDNIKVLTVVAYFAAFCVKYLSHTT